jgi:hypothetical protein
MPGAYVKRQKNDAADAEAICEAMMHIYVDPPHNTGNEGWVYNDNVNSRKINAGLVEAFASARASTLSHCLIRVFGTSRSGSRCRSTSALD